MIQLEEKNKNPYFQELEKIIGKEIEVTDIAMNKYTGICKAVSFNHLNIILKTDKELLVLKNISCIKVKQ